MSIAEKLTQIAENEPKIYDAGKAEGVAEGYAKGYNDGNTLYYSNYINSIFANVVFPENFNMTLKFEKMPNACANIIAGATNLKSIKIITDDKESSIKIDNTFRNCKSLTTIDLTECARKISSANYFDYDSPNVKSILGALDLSEITHSPLYSFSTTSLRDIEFVPNSINKSISFNCPYLTEVSKESIINGLADLTDSEAQTITFLQIGKNLTEDQKTRISAKNWTLAY